MKTTAERRKYDRLEKELVLRYAHFDDLPHTDFSKEGLVLDIGGGGLRFLSSEKWMKNDQLLMELDFDKWQLDGLDEVFIEENEGSRCLKVVGTVMWTVETLYDGQYEVGLRFTAAMKTEKS